MTHRDPDMRAANLGLATTREMLQELEARGRINALDAPTRREEDDSAHLQADAKHLLTILSPKVLDYKTVSDE